MMRRRFFGARVFLAFLSKKKQRANQCDAWMMNNAGSARSPTSELTPVRVRRAAVACEHVALTSSYQLGDFKETIAAFIIMS
jgi:hypothetical protein